MSLPDRYAGRPALPLTSVGQINAGRSEIREVTLRGCLASDRKCHPYPAR
jgi:hypothetical protein